MEEEDIEIKFDPRHTRQNENRACDINADLEATTEQPRNIPGLSPPQLLLLKRRAKTIEHKFQCETRKNALKD